MIKKFFLNLLSSFVGAWIAIVISGAVITLIVMAAIGKFATLSATTENTSVKSNTVLVLNLDGEIEETETSHRFDINMLLNGKIEKPQTLLSLVTALEEATEDPRIKAIYVKCGPTLSVSPATAHALFEALSAYKKNTGNPVVTYGDVITQGALYIAACSDKIYLNPQGQLMLTGCGSVGLYLKDLFDNIGIQWQVAKVGTYKSAVEPYTSNEMSEPARRQLMELYDAIWANIRKGIADGRGVSEEMIDSITNSMVLTYNAREVVKTKLISATAYEREMDSIIGKEIKVNPDDINFINAQAFGKANSMPNVSGKHIAVLYATGEIQENNPGAIDCYTMVPIINELAEDDNVTGLVLRVNSPGGSVFGSEQISDALNHFKSTGKPFVVSMGDYAASGGYWISCNADKIYADPLTITGSIGIFGLIPNCSELLKKVGVSTQSVSTNPNALIAVPYVPLNDYQMAALQKEIENGYRQFLEKVATGRKMTIAKVDTIGQGRVWIGTRAKQLGLVDEMGTLQSAVKFVAEKNKMKSPQVCYYPQKEPNFWDMIPSGVDTPLSQLLNKAMGQNGNPLLIWYLSNLLERNHKQAILPSYWEIKM